MEYADSNIGLTFEFWAYRDDNIDKIDDNPKDFWRADLGFSLKRFADERPGVDPSLLLREVGMNIAECLLSGR